MDDEMMRSAFQALSDATQLRIIKLLAENHSGGGADGFSKGLTEDEICFDIADPTTEFMTITHNLHELEAVGLISIGRKENLLTCSLRPFMLRDIADELTILAM
jgi:hypothetical protein